MGAAERIIEVASELLPDDRLRLVVEAGDDDPFVKLERIERGFASGQLPIDIPRQKSGFWFAPDEPAPSAPPSWLPNGALLPRIDDTLRDGAELLVLVPIDYVWFPLSERGAFTYAHSSGIRRGEAWRFVPCAGDGGEWPTEYAVELAPAIAWPEVEKLYGLEAARRARTDARSLQVRVDAAARGHPDTRHLF